MPRIRMLSTHGGSLGPLLPATEYLAGQEYDLPDTPGCLADVFVRERWAEVVDEAPPEVQPCDLGASDLTASEEAAALREQLDQAKARIHRLGAEIEANTQALADNTEAAQESVLGAGPRSGPHGLSNAGEVKPEPAKAEPVKPTSPVPSRSRGRRSR